MNIEMQSVTHGVISTFVKNVLSFFHSSLFVSTYTHGRNVIFTSTVSAHVKWLVLDFTFFLTVVLL